MKKPRVLASILIGLLILGCLGFARQSIYASDSTQSSMAVPPGTYTVETTHFTRSSQGERERDVYVIDEQGDVMVTFAGLGTGYGHLLSNVNQQTMLVFREIVPDVGYIEATQTVTAITQTGFSGQGYMHLYASDTFNTQKTDEIRSVATRSGAQSPLPSAIAVPTSPPVATPDQGQITPVAPIAPIAPVYTPPSTESGAMDASDASGQAMPVGDLPGWHQIFTEDFNTSIPLGDFPGHTYSSAFHVYSDGTPDTAGQQGAPSRYDPSKVVSVSNGLLNLYLHTENHTPMAAALLPNLPGNHLYGKYTIRFRSDALSGFKTAWLLWPDSGAWPGDGEIDFPEGDLSGMISGFVHHQNASSGSDQDVYHTTATYTAWHTASIEWKPGNVTFLLDGKVIGASVTRVPDTPMHWVIQTESCLDGCPDASEAGNLQIAWVTAYSYTGA